MSYTLFLGCVIPAREPSYELSLRKVFERLDVDLVDLKGAICCAPMPIESLSFNASLAIAAYNMCLTEEVGLDLMTLCNGCFQGLSRTNIMLKERKKLREDVNKTLAEVGREYRGTRRVKDYLQVLYNDLGTERIKKNVLRPLDRLKVAVFYGCHVLRPSSVLGFDDPEHPHVLEDLVKVTGAETVPYLHETRCCGGLLRGVSDELATKLARDKLYEISKANPDCVVTVCPFCFLQLDVGQFSVKRMFGEEYNVPIIHYTELMGLAMGMKPDELGLQTHRAPTDSLIQKIK